MFQKHADKVVTDTYLLRRLSAVMASLLIAFALHSRLEADSDLPAPEITSTVWLNSEPKRMADLRGKVVLVEFWTFGCYNCRNVEPYVNQGLTVIGVDSPEFKYERDVENVKRHIREHDIQYAMPIDNVFSTWHRYKNHYWPAIDVIDKQGIIRYLRFGEGAYEETEQQIRNLLAER